jgi:hypothetical protein
MRERSGGLRGRRLWPGLSLEPPIPRPPSAENRPDSLHAISFYSIFISVRGNLVIGLYLAILIALWATSSVRESWIGLVVLVMASTPAVLLLLLLLWRLRHRNLIPVLDAHKELQRLLSGHGDETRETIKAALRRVHDKADTARSVPARAIQLRAIQSVCTWAGARADDALLDEQYRQVAELVDNDRVAAKIRPLAMLVLDQIACDVVAAPRLAQKAFDKQEQVAATVAASERLSGARESFSAKQDARLHAVRSRIDDLAGADAGAGEAIRSAYEELRDCVAAGELRLSTQEIYAASAKLAVAWALRSRDDAFVAMLMRDLDETLRRQPETSRWLPGGPPAYIQENFEALTAIAFDTSPDLSEQALEILARLTNEYPSEATRYEDAKAAVERRR